MRKTHISSLLGKSEETKTKQIFRILFLIKLVFEHLPIYTQTHNIILLVILCQKKMYFTFQTNLTTKERIFMTCENNYQLQEFGRFSQKKKILPNRVTVSKIGMLVVGTLIIEISSSSVVRSYYYLNPRMCDYLGGGK